MLERSEGVWTTPRNSIPRARKPSSSGAGYRPPGAAVACYSSAAPSIARTRASHAALSAQISLATVATAHASSRKPWRASRGR